MRIPIVLASVFSLLTCVELIALSKGLGGINGQGLNLVPLGLIIVAPETGLQSCLVGWQ